MKTSSLILTHVFVFNIGIATAFLILIGRDNPSDQRFQVDPSASQGSKSSTSNNFSADATSAPATEPLTDRKMQEPGKVSEFSPFFIFPSVFQRSAHTSKR